MHFILQALIKIYFLIKKREREKIGDTCTTLLYAIQCYPENKGLLD